MKALKAVSILVSLAISALTFSDSSTLALYKTTDGKYYVSRIAFNGTIMDERKLQYKGFPAGEPLVVGMGMQNSTNQVTVSYTDAADKTMREVDFLLSGGVLRHRGQHLPSESFRVVGSARFDGEFWTVVQDLTSNEVFFADGTLHLKALNLSAVSLGSYTVPIGAGDFDGDGDGDIAFMDPARKLVRVVYFEGRNAVSLGPVLNPIAKDRDIVGVSDVDRNGSPDIIIKKPGQATRIRFFSGTTITTTVLLHGDNDRTLLSVGQADD